LTNMNLSLPESEFVSAKRLITNLTPYVGMFVLVLLLWLPFGLKTTGLVEEIGLTEPLDLGQQLFFLTPNSPLASSRTRPLQMFFFAASYALDHNSFAYYNVFMMLFMFGKMVVVYWLLLEFLPHRNLLAFMTAILFAIYPSDTGLFAFRTIHIHSATLAYLFAVYLLVLFWKRHNPISKLALIGAALLLIVSLWQYQIALPAALVTPLILLYFGRPNKRFWLGLGVWYGAMLAVLFYGIWVTSQSNVQTYEASILQPGGLTIDALKSMFQALLAGYQRQFTAWSRAVSRLNDLPLYWPYLLAGLVVTLGTGRWLLSWQKKQDGAQPAPVSHIRYLILFIAGVLLFGIGMAIYLPVPTHRFQEFRIYLVGILGSALVLMLILYFISQFGKRYRNSLFLILGVLFVCLALLNAFQQHQYYVNFSLQQQNVLQQTVNQAPQVAPNTAFVLIDNGDLLGSEYVLFYGAYWEAMLRYLYNTQEIRGYYCPSKPLTVLGIVNCQFDTGGLTISNSLSTNMLEVKSDAKVTVSNDRMLIFVTSADGTLKLLTTEEAKAEFPINGYNPQANIISDTLPIRATTLFSCEPALSCYKEEPVFPTSVFDLLVTAKTGAGWREAETDVDGSAFRWSIDRMSTVDVNLSDTNDLVVEFVIRYWLEEDVIDSLKLSVNGIDIPLTFELVKDVGRVYKASIPRSVLVGHPSKTALIFTVDHLSPVPNVPNVFLGIGLKALSVRPA
jgi:hypothetical protein